VSTVSRPVKPPIEETGLPAITYCAASCSLETISAKREVAPCDSTYVSAASTSVELDPPPKPPRPPPGGPPRKPPLPVR